MYLKNKKRETEKIEIIIREKNNRQIKSET